MHEEPRKLKRFCFLSVVTLVAIALPDYICSEQAREWPIRIKHCGLLSDKDGPRAQLCVVDGAVMFVTFGPHDPNDPPLPDHSLHFLWGGPIEEPRKGDIGVLVARIKPLGRGVGMGNVSKELLAKNGWYVTADFSTDLPQVILTEAPTKGSNWEAFEADYPGRFQFRNVGAPGEAVWLAMAKEGKIYRGGIARTPTLSAEKSRFSIEEANSGK